MTRHDARTPARHSLPLLVAAASLAVLLTACAEPAAEPIPTAGRPAPAATPPSPGAATASPSPAPTPTVATTSPARPMPTTGPTAKVPPMPKGATRPTEKGVTLAAIYYLGDLLEYMGLTGDAAPFMRYCRPKVVFCDELTEGAAERRQLQRYLVNGKTTFSEIDVGQTVIDGETHYYFDAIGHLEPGEDRNFAGELVNELPKALVRVQLTFVYVDGAWRIATGYSERLRVQS